ncbi:hypothetical protein [Bradyrhizobium manausense]|uniref:DNA primase n=1 Tax=Bradyrhizobium manausense TaxID=989370 RepID=A0A0R3DWM2_9BRAD|nr:hypothetical protein [Bradyrhizobium manausense]KRQ14250.1 hypothetical protein AOQ71_13305 [Bradyrhizobium manausense]
MTAPRRIAFQRIAEAAIQHADAIVTRWLPGGKREGSEWCALNPMRADGRKGSFKVNLKSGKWGDFATGDRGGDLIALAAYLHRLDQGEAAKKLADMLGIDAYE